MGPLIASFLCALPRWRLWQNCHFRHISQIRRFRQLLWAPFTALCFASLAIVANIFAKFAAFANFYGAPILLCALPRWRLWQNCHFRHICQIRQHYLFFAIFVVLCISGHISRLLVNEMWYHFFTFNSICQRQSHEVSLSRSR